MDCEDGMMAGLGLIIVSVWVGKVKGERYGWLTLGVGLFILGVISGDIS